MSDSDYNTLSLEQKFAFEKFRKGNNLFITGPGGTGKSRFIKYISQWAEAHKRHFAVCAMTGCAAVLLECNAKTIHSWSGIRLAKGDASTVIATTLKNKYAVKMWKKTSILILDEVSMLSRRIFEILDAIGKSARRSQLPFGGIQLIFSGDFYQLPPIPEEGETQFCFESPLWKQTFKPENCIELTHIFRQNDPTYINILMEVRKGQISEENAKLLTTYVKRPIDTEKTNGCIPTKLFPVRHKVESVNNVMFSQLKTEEYEYNCISKTDCAVYMDTDTAISLSDIENGKHLTIQEKELEIKMLISQSQTVDALSLKIGATVMCTANLDLDLGICNGAQGTIVDFAPSQNALGFAEVPVVLFSNGVKMRIPIVYRHSTNYPTIAVGQIPLCLAWALTIHKIQGATMSMAEIDVGTSIFECGQTYVALSRIKSLDGLYLSSFHPSKIKTNPKVIVFYSTFPQHTKQDMLAYIHSNRNREPEVLPTIQQQLHPHTKIIIQKIGKSMILPENTQLSFEQYACPDSSNNEQNVKKIIL
jgi:ATP-dependent DNA helicase PIF1